jgi:hypothetical protein
MKMLGSTTQTLNLRKTILKLRASDDPPQIEVAFYTQKSPIFLAMSQFKLNTPLTPYLTSDFSQQPDSFQVAGLPRLKSKVLKERLPVESRPNREKTLILTNPSQRINKPNAVPASGVVESQVLAKYPALRNILKQAERYDAVSLNSVLALVQGGFNLRESLLRIYQGHMQVFDTLTEVPSWRINGVGAGGTGGASVGNYLEPSTYGKAAIRKLLERHNVSVNDYLEQCRKVNVNPLRLLLAAEVYVTTTPRQVVTSVEMKGLMRRFPVLSQIIERVGRLGLSDADLINLDSQFNVSVTRLGSGTQSIAFEVLISTKSGTDHTALVLKYEHSRARESFEVNGNATVPYTTVAKAIQLLLKDAHITGTLRRLNIRLNPIYFGLERSPAERVANKGLTANLSIWPLVSDIDQKATEALHKRSYVNSNATRRIDTYVVEINKALAKFKSVLGMSVHVDTIDYKNFLILKDGTIVVIDPFKQ